MQKRRFFAVVLVVVVLGMTGCGRKGTGCPTFSLSSAVEQLQKSL